MLPLGPSSAHLWLSVSGIFTSSSVTLRLLPSVPSGPAFSLAWLKMGPHYSLALMKQFIYMLNLIIRILVNYFRIFWQQDVHRLLLRDECTYVCVWGDGVRLALPGERGPRGDRGFPQGGSCSEKPLVLEEGPACQS